MHTLPGPAMHLGESPVWDEGSQSLVWVDIHRGELWSGTRHNVERLIQADYRIGCVGLAGDRSYVLGADFGFVLLREGETKELARVEQDTPSTRLNDGRADRQGRFVAGGMDEADPQRGIAAVHRIGPDGQAAAILGGVHCANAMCFSPEGATMYFSDMPTRTIVAYRYDADDGVPHDPVVFADLSGQPGLADGSTVDRDGYVWNAQWGGGRLVRYDPLGRVSKVVELPVSNPTSVGFGGRGYESLFVTTARFGLTSQQLLREPLAGRVFVVEGLVPGLPEPVFDARRL